MADSPNAPRDDLIRMSSRLELRDDSGDGRTLHGYLAMFNEPTTINSWEGRFVEKIAPGAFKKTLSESRDRVVALFNHGMDPSIGDKPLGRFQVLEEDELGLRFEPATRSGSPLSRRVGRRRRLGLRICRSGRFKR